MSSLKTELHFPVEWSTTTDCRVACDFAMLQPQKLDDANSFSHSYTT